MRKVLISEQQANILLENHTKTVRFNSICDEIFSNGFDMLNRNLILKILSDRYDGVVGYFSDNIEDVGVEEVMTKLNRLLKICIEKEDKIKPQLESICIGVLTEIFKIPEDDVQVDLSITPFIDQNTQEFHIEPMSKNSDERYENTDMINDERNEIAKRKLVNCLVTGMAMKIYSKARKLFIDEIFELDETLPQLYSKIMKISEYLLFKGTFDITDKNHMQGGISKIYLGNGENKNRIVCEGQIFPILLFETIKAILELISSNGLPNDANMMKKVIDESDILVLDPTNMRIGPYLADKLCDDSEIGFYPYILDTFAKLRKDNIVKAVEEICYETKFSDKLKKKILDMSFETSEKESFNKDILQKQNNISMITDSYFTFEELRR